MKLDVAGLKVDNFTKQELLKEIADRLKNNRKTFVITPYSEFLYHGLKNPELLKLFNQADFSVPDGIGIFFAQQFLNRPLTAKSYYGKILQAWWQAKITLLKILLGRGKRELPEKIPGSDLVWDLARLAEENNWSIYLLGGFGDTPKIVADKLSTYTLMVRGREPSAYNKPLVVGYSSKNTDDPTVIDDIKNTNPDMIFVAYGPIKQEAWITQNMQNLPAKLYIGLGGTFDYIAGKHLAPPRFLRYIGLEWLWRLITQPQRIGRIWNATVGLVTILIQYKVFHSMSYRKNVVCVILNEQDEILIARRNPIDSHGNNIERLKKYWQFPQGGINKNEDVVSGAMREAQEEVGLAHLRYLRTSTQINTYNWTYTLKPLLYENEYYKGQKQSIVYFRCDKSSQVKIDNHEFVEWKWVSQKDLNSIIHPERLPLVTIVQEDLKDLA